MYVSIRIDACCALKKWLHATSLNVFIYGLLITSAFCCCLLVHPVATHGQMFRGLDASHASEVSGISSSGSLVFGADSSQQGVQWLPSGEVTARDLNNTVGLSGDGATLVGSNAVGQPVRMGLFSQELHVLADLVGLATATSDDGAVVVGQLGSGPLTGVFRWEEATGLVDIRTLPGGLVGGGVFNEATAVSGDGRVLVGAGATGQGQQAIRWTEEDAGHVLGDLPGGDVFSLARDVSRDGAVVIGQSESGSGMEAFHWSTDGGMKPLGDLGGSEFFSDALGVSADGTIVVGTAATERFEHGQEAFIWDDRNGMRSLQQVLADDYQLDIGDWQLFSAVGISADGNTIVGNGSNGAWIVELGTRTRGDFNGDGNVNLIDIDLLSNSVAANVYQPSLDINADGQLNSTDLRSLLVLSGTLPGDTNLDGRVSFVDFLTLSQNFGRETTSWSSGDFDSNARVEFPDFTILSSSFGLQRGAGVVSVPEPSFHRTIVMPLALCLIILMRRLVRRQCS